MDPQTPRAESDCQDRQRWSQCCTTFSSSSSSPSSLVTPSLQSSHVDKESMLTNGETAQKLLPYVGFWTYWLLKFMLKLCVGSGG